MNPDGTYISHLTHQLIRTVDADHAALAATIVDMCSKTEDGEKLISMDFLAGLFGDSVRTIQRRLQKLQFLHLVDYEAGLGKGNYCRFKKGDNYDALSGLKGDKNDTFCESQKATKIAAKGDKNDAIYNNRIKKVEDTRASARTSDPSSLEEVLNASQGDTPCNPQTNTSMKYPFDDFWAAFKVSPEYTHERESCERQWSVMSDLMREDIIKYLQSRKAKNPNPHWFLHDYRPTSLRIAAIGTIVSRDKYYDFYGHDMPVDGWSFEKPEGYERFMFVKRNPTTINN